MAGVYLIYNTETGKRYIGSSINIEERLKQHRRKLKSNKHCNQHLLNAWNKYAEYLVFEPLEYCEPDECLKLELKYIDYYNSANREYGYNIDALAASAGKHLSEETKQKLRERHLGKKIDPKIVEKVRQANLGKKRPKLSETMKRKYAEGYTIPRLTDMPLDKQIEWRKHISESTKKRFQKFENRPEGLYVKCIFSNDVKYYPSLREAARQLGVDNSGIKYVIKYTQGYMKKLNCTFVLINREEYINNRKFK